MSCEAPPDAQADSGLLHGGSFKCETLGVTAPHPFWVCNREQPGFVAAADLKSGDELLTANGRSAVVTANETEHAAKGASFHTYNFEVEDFHTYFVGGLGVWVHNFSRLFCDELQTALNNLRKKMGIPDGVPLDGQKFSLLDAAFDAERAAGKAIMSKQGNFAMHVTGVDEITSYAQRFPNGSASNPVEQIASYTNQKEMQQKFAKGAKLDKPSYHYEVHHLSEKRVSEALGIPESQWDTSPGINLPERPPPANGGFDASDVEHYFKKFGHYPVYHQGRPDGIAVAIEDIFKKEMNIPYRKVLPDDQKQELVDRLCHLYTYDTRYKDLQLWPATRDWLKKNVPSGCVIPDSVPAVLNY
jgi:hypothetical protein